MERSRIVTLATTAIAVLIAPLTASAQEIHVSPESRQVEFGAVVVGESATQIVSLTALGDIQVTVYLVLVTDDATPGSLYTGVEYSIPFVGGETISGGATFEVPVNFTPSDLELYAAYLWIYSNDLDEQNIFVSLNGEGVEASPPVADIMAELITFFNDADVAGSGPGSSADGRLGALGKMLNAANDLILAGAHDMACVQLQDALDRCDGLQPPPDFVDGEDKAGVAARIEGVMDALGCP